MPAWPQLDRVSPWPTMSPEPALGCHELAGSCSAIHPRLRFLLRKVLVALGLNCSNTLKRFDSFASLLFLAELLQFFVIGDRDEDRGPLATIFDNDGVALFADRAKERAQSVFRFG